MIVPSIHGLCVTFTSIEEERTCSYSTKQGKLREGAESHIYKVQELFSFSDSLYQHFVLPDVVEYSRQIKASQITPHQTQASTKQTNI